MYNMISYHDIMGSDPSPGDLITGSSELPSTQSWTCRESGGHSPGSAATPERHTSRTYVMPSDADHITPAN
jgi:hypothetical protein